MSGITSTMTGTLAPGRPSANCPCDASRAMPIKISAMPNSSFPCRVNTKSATSARRRFSRCFCAYVMGTPSEDPELFLLAFTFPEELDLREADMAVVVSQRPA